ncbi:MAG: glycosyltransferase family 87 protein [Candidatus Binatia bacterium]
MNSSHAWSNRVKAILLGLGLGLVFHTSGNWWKILTDRVPECGQPNCVADFVTFYAEAKLFWDEPQSLYDLDRQLAYQKRIAPTERVLPFVYPPITAALMAPLALLPFPIAFLAMTLLNLALLMVSLRLLIRKLSLTRDQAQWLLLFALCNFGAHAVVFYGQTSAIILYFLTGHILAQKQSAEYKAGIWAALLSVKPQFLPIPHGILFLRGQWRGLLLGVFFSLALIAGAFLFVGVETSKQYFDLARRMMVADDDWWNQWRSMHNLRALTIYWLPPTWQAYVWWAGITLAFSAVIAVNLRWNKKADGFALTWIVNVLGLLIVIPHLFTHDLTLLILPCALFLSLFKQGVPLLVGLGLVLLAALPAVNHVLPTSMATALVILYILSLTQVAARTAERSSGPQNLLPSANTL